MSKEYGLNIKNRIKKIKHTELLRFGDSIYKSQCPECVSGILFVLRDPKDFKLMNVDRCTCCGQQFEYADFQELVNDSRTAFKIKGK